ncbi:MAG: ceramidase [Myxococcota bacterium]|nr:ceramidase [Myxococcota bacterium]
MMIDRARAETAAFWGAPTSSVDWCEANYEHSRYVCELFNTVSSGALVLAGVVGLAIHWRVLERRFLVAFGALALVGVGSAAFHATLKFELQMLDELPMIYLALVVVFIVLDMRPRQTSPPWLAAALVAYGLAGTAVAALTRGSRQFWGFQISFGCLEVFCLVRVWLTSRRSRNASVRRLFGTGMACYLVAIALWFLDVRFCPVFSTTLPALGLFNPQLHAMWHVLVSAGFYCLLLLLALERIEACGLAGRVGYGAGWLPHIVTRYTNRSPPSRAPTPHPRPQ